MKEKNNSLIRDKYSKALLLTNLSEVKEYKSKKENEMRISILEKEVKSLKTQLEEIRSLLKN